jgi:RNA polymerase sigma-54 factor
MKQNLQLRISQNLALTPQLQQSIRLLQLSTIELNQELETILQDNPLLELVEGEDDGGGAETSVESLPEATSSDAGDSDSGNIEADSNIFDSATISEISTPTEVSAERGDDDTPVSAEEFSSPEFEDDYDEYGSASNWDEGGRQNNSDDDDGDFTRQDTVSISLRDHLIGQLKLVPLSERDQTLVSIMIDCINDDGYFEQSLEALAESLPL